MNALWKLLWCVFLILASCAGLRAAGVHHYVFFATERERISDTAFLEIKAFEGAQLKYSWRQLEHGEDGYDFGDIEHDLAFLHSKDKKLFIQIQDISYDMSIVPVPRYLLNQAQYHGGVDKQYNIQGDDEEHATPEGWVARRWDPAVRDRFQKLLQALGKQFDGRIEGINLPETAIDFGRSARLRPEGFTDALYNEAVFSTMAALKRAFPRSVAMQYANFMTDPAALRAVYERAKELHVALGGPDLMPYKPGQMDNSYPLLREFSGSFPTGIAVQDGNYEHINPKTHKQVTIPELIEFATNYLKVDYIFWCTQEPYYSKTLIPFMRSEKRDNSTR